MSKNSGDIAAVLERMERREEAERDERQRRRQIKALIAGAERKTGDGKEIGGTGLTRLKYDRIPLVYLFEAQAVVKGRPNPKKIYADELRAADDIQTAYLSQTRGLLMASQSYERVSRSSSGYEPYAIVDAIGRYKPWANFWSARARLGDKTFEIVIDAVCDQRPLRSIDQAHGLRNGFSGVVVASALRDYLARAGWADPRQAKAWMEAAEANFTLRKPVESSPNAA